MTQAIGVELIVEDLDRAIELFTRILGFEVASRGSSAEVEGRVAVIDAGAIAITLLEPASGGPGHVLSERTPRLSQLIIGVANTTDGATLLNRATEAGLASAVTGPGTFYLTPESVSGALGQRTAVVVVPVASDAGPA